MWNKYFSIQKIDFGRRNWIIYYKNYYLAIHIKLTITILGDVSLFTCFFGIKLNNLKKKKKNYDSISNLWRLLHGDCTLGQDTNLFLV